MALAGGRVLRGGRAGEVPARDALDRRHRGWPDDEGPPVDRGPPGTREPRRVRDELPDLFGVGGDDGARRHPCQLLADLMTATEHWGDLRGRTVAYIGDGSNNMAHSWMEAAQIFDFQLHIGSPAGYTPTAAMLQTGGNHVTILHDAVAAVRGADLIVTDVWTSMGQEEEAAARKAILAPFQVNATLMAAAAADALFMHCLPARRGEEVSAEVIDGPRSVVWEEAENRLHAQKALMELLFGIGPVAALQGD